MYGASRHGGPPQTGPLPVPVVDPVGIVRVPSGWSRAAEPSDRSRSGALLVAAWFGLAAIGTSVLSLGAYCLTSDGADARALVGAPAPAGSPVLEPGPAAVACSVEEPSDRPRRIETMIERIAELARPEAPPIDRRHPAVVETATFALG